MSICNKITTVLLLSKYCRRLKQKVKRTTIGDLYRVFLFIWINTLHYIVLHIYLLLFDYYRSHKVLQYHISNKLENKKTKK